MAQILQLQLLPLQYLTVRLQKIYDRFCYERLKKKKLFTMTGYDRLAVNGNVHYRGRRLLRTSETVSRLVHQKAWRVFHFKYKRF